MELNNVNQQNEIQLGNLSLQMPNGYEWGGLNKDNDIAIKNGTNTIYLSNTNNTDIKQEVENYITYLKNRNLSFTQSVFEINNISVEKVTEGGTEHYWFETNGSVYTIYTWESNEKMEETVREIITSIRNYWILIWWINI